MRSGLTDNPIKAEDCSSQASRTPACRLLSTGSGQEFETPGSPPLSCPPAPSRLLPGPTIVQTLATFQRWIVSPFALGPGFVEGQVERIVLQDLLTQCLADILAAQRIGGMTHGIAGFARTAFRAPAGLA